MPQKNFCRHFRHFKNRVFLWFYQIFQFQFRNCFPAAFLQCSSCNLFLSAPKAVNDRSINWNTVFLKNLIVHLLLIWTYFIVHFLFILYLSYCSLFVHFRKVKSLLLLSSSFSHIGIVLFVLTSDVGTRLMISLWVSHFGNQRKSHKVPTLCYFGTFLVCGGSMSNPMIT